MASNGRLARLHAHLSDDATASALVAAAEAEADPLEMTPTEKFMFDLQGYLVRAHTAGLLDAPCLILERPLTTKPQR